MKVFLTGSSGQLGWEIKRVFKNHRLINCDLPSCDVSQSDKIIKTVAQVKPDLVIHAAAYTAVDKAESEPALSFLINEQGSANVARAAKHSRARLVAISTDFVFDGWAANRKGPQKLPYTENDVPRPATVYGASKLAGERAIQAVGGHYLICRTAWLYGGRPVKKSGLNPNPRAGFFGNFPNAILTKALALEPISVVNDQIGSPTFGRDVARAVLTMVNLDLKPGVYHLVNTGAVSWYQLAQELISLAGLKTVIKPVTSEQFPRPAARPTFSALSNTRLSRLGVDMTGWQEALAGFMKRS